MAQGKSHAPFVIITPQGKSRLSAFCYHYGKKASLRYAFCCKLWRKQNHAFAQRASICQPFGLWGRGVRHAYQRGALCAHAKLNNRHSQRLFRARRRRTTLASPRGGLPQVRQERRLSPSASAGHRRRRTLPPLRDTSPKNPADFHGRQEKRTRPLLQSQIQAGFPCAVCPYLLLTQLGSGCELTRTILVSP